MKKQLTIIIGVTIILFFSVSNLSAKIDSDTVVGIWLLDEGMII